MPPISPHGWKCSAMTSVASCRQPPTRKKPSTICTRCNRSRCRPRRRGFAESAIQDAIRTHRCKFPYPPSDWLGSDALLRNRPCISAYPQDRLVVNEDCELRAIIHAPTSGGHMEQGEIRIQGLDKLEQFTFEKEIPPEYVKVDT